jgi:hypothetical protein
MGERVGQTAWEKARSKARSASKREPHPKEKEWFAPHIRFEVANLLEGIRAERWSRGRDALELVLSSILVKVSNLRADSSQARVERRMPRGLTSELFMDRCNELVGMLGELREACPEDARSPRIRVGDARQIHGVEPGSVRLVLTSPPYPGTYDYAAHQELRCGMLGIDDSRAHTAEIGSRREGQLDPRRAFSYWRQDVRRFLEQMARALEDGGDAVLLIGDSRIGEDPVHNDGMVLDQAREAGLELVAIASQALPDRHPNVPARRQQAQSRPEHLIWLRRLPRRDAPDPAGEPRRPTPPPGPRPERAPERPPDRGPRGDGPPPRGPRPPQDRGDRDRRDDRPRNDGPAPRGPRPPQDRGDRDRRDDRPRNDGPAPRGPRPPQDRGELDRRDDRPPSDRGAPPPKRPQQPRPRRPR